MENRHREVAVHALGGRRVRLKAMLHVKEPLHAVAIPDQGVEGREQRRAKPLAGRRAQPLQCLRRRPGALVPIADRHLDQVRFPDVGAGVANLEPVDIGDVPDRADADRVAAELNEPA